MTQAEGNSTLSTANAVAASPSHPTVAAVTKAFDAVWTVIQEAPLTPGQQEKIHEALTAMAYDNQALGYARAKAEPGFPPHHCMLQPGSDVRSLAGEMVHAATYARDVGQRLDEAGGWEQPPFAALAQLLYLASVRLHDRLDGLRGESVSDVLPSVSANEGEVERRAQRLVGVAS